MDGDVTTEAEVTRILFEDRRSRPRVKGSKKMERLGRGENLLPGPAASATRGSWTDMQSPEPPSDPQNQTLQGGGLGSPI